MSLHLHADKLGRKRDLNASYPSSGHVTRFPLLQDCRTQKAQGAALIQKPLSELLAGSSPQRVLLVIDAVDECGTDDDMSHIVELLLDARGVNQTVLRIFVTSRPEVAIHNGFEHDLDQRHLNLVLQLLHAADRQMS